VFTVSASSPGLSKIYCNDTLELQFTYDLLSVMFIDTVLIRLLISAPSLGVYYCQQSVCLSVTNFKLLLLFLFLDGIEPFLAVSSP